MSLTHYWTGSVFVAEWTLTEPGATVSGLVRQPPSNPDGTMGVDSTDDPVHLLSFQPSVPGRHVAVLTATGAVEGSEQVPFVVRRDMVGLAPITVDAISDIGRVRLLCTDLDETSPLFEDAQIEAFIAMETGLKRAAAMALETIAVSETLLSKRITTQDLSTDGPAVAKSLMDRAKVLRTRAQEEQNEDDDTSFGLEISALSSFPAPNWWGDCNL